jgi:nucleolar complex protein 2
MVQSFFRSVTYTLSSLVASNEPSPVAAFLLSTLGQYIPLLAPLPRLTKYVIKVMLAMWSQNVSVSDDNNTRVHAYLRLRQMSILLPGATAEDCFRMVYQIFARSAKTFSTVTSSSVLFMTKCIVELYLTDVAMSYQHVFLHIRQLALLLRSAVQKKTAETSKQILNWQYLNCIRLWTRVVCAMPGKDELGGLAFPLAQIMLGVISAAPSSVNIPIRFHLIACLHQLAAHCQLFIPTAPKLLEVLELAELVSKPIPSTDAPPALQHIVRFLPDACSKANVRDLIVSEIVSLLQQDADIYRYNVGFPEYTFLTIRRLKSFVKKSKISRWRDQARSLANHLEQHAAVVKKQRVQLKKSPMEIKDFETLLPPQGVPASQRLSKLVNNRSVVDVSEVTVGNVVSSHRDEENELIVKKKARVAKLGTDVSESQAEGNETDMTMKKKKKTTKVTAKISSDLIPDEVDALDWSDEEA